MSFFRNAGGLVKLFFRFPLETLDFVVRCVAAGFILLLMCLLAFLMFKMVWLAKALMVAV